MKTRVAVVQFGTGTNVEENLKTCLRMIDEAGKVAPNFVVLPEFSNHCAIYESLEYADKVALGLDGDFLREIAAKAIAYNTYIKINVTVKKSGDKPTVSNLLYSPEGKLVGRADKQVLMGNENNFCSRAEMAGDIIETEFGKVGMYCCADGLLMETSRLLAIRGAKLLLNSLNSFAEDEANLHIPVRAAENKVFVAAACKVDYLVPKEILSGFAAKMNIKPEALQGAGESQIVAPDGKILAKAKREGEGVVFADIDLAEAENEDFLASRRPEIYAPIAEKPVERNYKSGAKSVLAAVCQNIETIAETDAKLIVLPELFEIKDFKLQISEAESESEISDLKSVICNAELDEAVENSKQIVEKIKSAIGKSEKFVVTSIVGKSENGTAHIGVLIDKSGVVFRQKQIHHFRRHEWISDFGDELKTFETNFGKIALIVGEDALFPETFRLAAYQNCEIVAVSFDVQERWETEFGLLERAVENRFSIAAATRPKVDLGEFGSSLIATISEDFTLWTEWKTRPFDGNINFPSVKRGNNIEAEIFPANAENRFVSQQTDVVDGRAWWLLEPLTN